MTFHRSLGFFLFFWGIMPLKAQISPCNWEVTIQLKSAEKTDLGGLEIFLESSHQLQFTNELGMATFQKLCDSNLTFDVVLPDTHLHFNAVIHQARRDTFEININLPADWKIFDLIEIKSARKKSFIIDHGWVICDLPLGGTWKNLNFQEIHLSLGKLLSNLSMVQLTQAGGTIAKPMIQGMAGVRAPLYWNGLRVEGQNWGGDHAPELALFGDEFISFNKGSEAIKFGGDLWGNMVQFSNVFSSEMYENNYIQNIEYQSNGNGIKFTGALNIGHNSHQKIKRSYFKYSSSIIGDYAVPEGILKNTGNKEFSIAGGHQSKSSEIHYSFYQTENGIYTGSHVGNITDLNAAIHSAVPLVMTNKSSYNIDLPKQFARQISISAKHPIIQKLFIQWGYQHNLRQEYSYSLNNDPGMPQISISLNTLSGKLYYQWSKLKIEIGTDQQAMFQRYTSNYLVPSYNGYKSGVYISKMWNHEKPQKARLNQEITLRFDGINRQGYANFNEPFSQMNLGFSGGYSFKISSLPIFKQNQQYFEAHVSQIWRPAAPNELFSNGIHHGSAAYEQGDKQLTPETGEKLDFIWQGLLVKGNHHWTYAISAFGQYSPNFILLMPQSQPVLTVKGAFPAFKYQQQATIYAGAESNFRYTYKPSKTDVLILDQKTSTTYATFVKGEYPISIPITFSMLNVTLYPWVNHFFSLSVVHNFKQRWYTEGSDFLPPPNASTIYKLNYSGKINSFWQLGIYIDNLTNTSYRNYTDRFRYFTNMPGRNIGVNAVYQIHHHRKHRD